MNPIIRFCLLALAVFLNLETAHSQTTFSKENAERAFNQAKTFAFETAQGDWRLVGYVDLRFENIGRYDEKGLKNQDQSYQSIEFTKERVDDFFDGTITKQIARLKNLGAFRNDEGPYEVKVGEQGVLFSQRASGSAGAFFDFDCREIDERKLICGLTLRLLQPENAYPLDRTFNGKLTVYSGYIRKR